MLASKQIKKYFWITDEVENWRKHELGTKKPPTSSDQFSRKMLQLCYSGSPSTTPIQFLKTLLQLPCGYFIEYSKTLCNLQRRGSSWCTFQLGQLTTLLRRRAIWIHFDCLLTKIHLFSFSQSVFAFAAEWSRRSLKRSSYLFHLLNPPIHSNCTCTLFLKLEKIHQQI